MKNKSLLSALFTLGMAGSLLAQWMTPPQSSNFPYATAVTDLDAVNKNIVWGAGSPNSVGNAQFMTTGDFNHDGKNDLATSNFADNSIAIYFNNDSGKFKAPIYYGTGGFTPQGLVSGWFNADSIADLAVVNYHSGTLAIYFGTQGDSIIMQPNNIVLGNYAYNVAAGWVDNDTILDLVTVHTQGVVNVLIGNGDGTFKTPVAYSCGLAQPQNVALADVDGDTFADVVVNGNVTTAVVNIAILKNSGTGTFSGAATTYTTGTASNGMTVADFNNDGKPDIATCHLANTNNIAVLINTGTSFAAVVKYTAGTQVFNIASGKMKMGGNINLIVSNYASPGKVNVLAGKGDGTFKPAVASLTDVAYTRALTVADINGDTLVDAIAANISSNTGTTTSPYNVFLSVLIAKDSTSFKAPLNTRMKDECLFTKTMDGGLTWTSGLILGSDSMHLSSFEAYNKDTTVACFYNNITATGGKILVTKDGGATWARIDTPGMFDGKQGAFLNIVHFFDPMNGIAIGDPVGGYYEIYHTTDGATTWTRLAQSAAIVPQDVNEFALTDVYYTNGDVIWFGTNQGRIIKSSDKGMTWTAQTVTGSTGEGIQEIIMQDANTGIVVSNTNPASVTSLYKTTDGGATYTNMNASLGFVVYDMEYIPGTNGQYIATSSTNPTYGSYFSNDTCNTWFALDQNAYHWALEFIDAQNGWSGSTPLNPGTDGMYKWSGASIGVSEASNINAGSVVYPNPFNQFTTLRVLKNQVKINKTVNVYDAMGKLVMSSDFFGAEFIINREGWNNGMYFYNVVDTKNNNVISSGKLAVE